MPLPLRSPHAAWLALLGCGALVLGACHKSGLCRRDSDCDPSQVCFADGCGDPAQGIRVEVSTQSTSGAFAQDLALDDIHARQDIVVSSPGVLQASIQFLDGNPPQAMPYNNSIAIRGRGESEIIPGVTRTFEATLAPGREVGAGGSCGASFCLPVNAGVYSITANTLDPLIPPATTQTRTAVRPGSTSIVDFLLGPLTNPQIVVQVNCPSSQTGLAIQAFSDPVAARPLSQRRPACPGVSLQLSPAVLLNSSFVVQVAPLDPLAVVPQKTFGPFPSTTNPAPLTLEMGEFGGPVLVTGRIVDSQGVGLSGATVYVDGRVGGGGTFRSQGVLTDDTGSFSLDTLRSAADSNSTVWVIPPAQSASGILRLRRAIEGTGSVSIGDLVCPDKVVVQGKIFKSDDSNAPGVRVIAVPIQALNGLPLPGNGDQASTDGESSFSLKLDPAAYRLDFIPGDQLPRASRFVAIAPDPNPSGGYRPIQLSDFALSKGRRLTGNVLAPPSPNESVRVAPFTSLRFFRLINDLDGRPSSVLLAETVSDARGAYSVSLPSR